VDIAENCAPSGINNAIRELMADMADVNDGTVALVSPEMDSADINGGTIDGTVIGGTTPAAGTFTTGDFNTSLNVDGTITSDGLTVDGTSLIENSTTSTVTISESTGSGTAELRFVATESFPKTKIVTDVSAGSLSLETLGNERLNIANNGDISFYEDTGTTAKLFWDASAETLNIGDIPTTIDGTLAVRSDASSHAISIYEPVGANENWQIGVDADGDLGFYNSGSTTASVTFDDSGSVGIGNTVIDSNSKLDVSGGKIYADNLLLNDGASGSLNNRLGCPSANTIGIFTNDTRALTIDASQNVGIGTSSPDTYGGALVVADGSAGGATHVTITNNNVNQFIKLGVVGNLAQIGYDDGDGIAFGQFANSTGTSFSSEAMRIDSSGNVGIGTSSISSSYILNVNGGILADGDHGLLNDTNEANFFHNLSSNSQIYFGFDDLLSGNTIQSYGFYAGNGSTTFVPLLASAFTVSSDYRLKENVTSLSDAITRLKQLSPKRFTWVENNPMGMEPTQVVDGFLAHEVKDVIPEAVHGEKDAEIGDKGDGYQRLDQSKLVPLLTAALQEAITKIETLEAKVTALENA
jgi:hypothetical protein